MAGIKTRRRQAEAAAAAAAAGNPLFPAGNGTVQPIYVLSSGAPATAAAPMGPFAPTPTVGAAGLKPGQYYDSQGKLRNANGERVVSSKTLAARNKVAGFNKQTLYIIGGVVVVVALVIWWRKTHPSKTYLQRLADAGKAGVAGVKKAAGVA